MARKSTKHLVIHCSATRAIQDIGAKEIRSWHKGQGWTDIGYHYVIRRSGKVEPGRARDAVGAHVGGHNSNTLGICMVGGLANKAPWAPENNYTPEQWTSLKTLVASLLKFYPNATILGHRDFPKVAKACPCFNAKEWARKNGFKAA